jgi:hypothetical protein
MYFYMHRNISEFVPEAPAIMNASKAEAIELSQSDVQIFAKDLWEWVENVLDGEAFMTAQQRKILWEVWNPGDKMPSTQYVNRALSALCQVKAGTVKEHGKVINGAWIVRKKVIIDAIGHKVGIARSTGDAIVKLVDDESNGY